MSNDLLLMITPLRKPLERIQRKAEPLLAKPNLLETEEGEDLLDVICMQFLAAGEALKRLEKLQPGLLAAIRSLERTIQAGETEAQQTERQHTEQMGLGL